MTRCRIRPRPSASKWLVAGLVCLIVACVGATPASAFFTSHRSGAVGKLLEAYYNQRLVLCSAYQDNSRYVTAGGTRVKPAWKYRKRWQRISGIARLEVWDPANQTWLHSAWGEWRSKRVAPGRVARLNGYDWKVPRGWSWRVSMRYEWRVAGRRVGRRVYYFEYLDYWANEARYPTTVALQGPIDVGNPGDGISSWCTLP
jgi:hypothetical protein